jgi:cobyrinic acid a,c-diamide synthase
VIREAIESICEVPVLGVVPRAPEGALLASRHLGLVTPREHAGRDALVQSLLDRVASHLEFDRLLEIARGAPPLRLPAPVAPPAATAKDLTIGYLNDSAFSFYYPENLEALGAAGARLEPISALADAALPEELDALYIGGGFPETHARGLAENAGFLSSLRRAARAGLPVYAECGGLMLLARTLEWRGNRYPMAGVFDLDIAVCDTPQGHGYAELVVDTPNPFFAVGTHLKGHEFHYSRVVPEGAAAATACAVHRGTGCFAGRDAMLAGNVWAAYTHLHALATPEWAQGLLRAARAARVAV